MKIVRERRLVEGVNYARVFRIVEPSGKVSGAGFGFPCDQNGSLAEMAAEAKDTFSACLTGVVRGERVIDLGVEDRPYRYFLPAIGQCDVCRRPVELEGFTNTCECGAGYNWSGQRLAPREQWGEETGEHYSDILRGE